MVRGFECQQPERETMRPRGLEVWEIGIDQVSETCYKASLSMYLFFNCSEVSPHQPKGKKRIRTSLMFNIYVSNLYSVCVSEGTASFCPS